MKKTIRSFVSMVLTVIIVLNTLPLTALADVYYGYLDGNIGVKETRGGVEDEPNDAPSETQTVAEYQVVFNDYVFDGGVITGTTAQYGIVTVQEGETASIGAPDHEGYRFLGWSASLENVTSDMAVTARYERIADVYTLRVDYLTSSGDVLESSWEKQYIAGTQVQETIASPVLMGYTVDLAQVVFSIPSIAANETRTVRYTPSQTTYTVEHYRQNAEGAGYTKVDADTAIVPATSGETVTAGAKTYDGFTATKASSQAKVAGDGSTVIKFYYDRNFYTITFDGQGGIPPAAISQRYGSTIDWSLLEATRGGYVFTGWAETTTGTGSLAPVATMPKENKTYYAKWTAQTVNYTVVYWLENAEDTDYSYLKAETKTATAENTVTLTASDVSLTGYTDAAHFTFASSDTVTIKGDGSSVVNVRYSRKSYTFTFTNNTQFNFTAKYASNISARFPLKSGNTTYNITYADSATKTLYPYVLATIDIMPGQDCTFSVSSGGSGKSIYYWVETPGGSRTYNGKTFAQYKLITVGFSFVTYAEEYYPITGFDRWYAVGATTYGPGVVWTQLNWLNNRVDFYYSRKSYNLEYNNGYTVVQTVAKDYESNFTTAELAYVPTVPSQLPSDATFDGWYYGPGGSGGLVTTAKQMPASNFVVFANWRMPNRTISIKVDVGNNTSQTYNYGESTVAPQAPTKEGYVFSGWYYVSTDNQYVFGQPIYENATIEARWVQEENLGYVVKHIADGQATVMTTVSTGYAAGATVTETALTTAELVQEGWESGVLYVPDATTKSITIQETASENVIEFHYAVRKSYIYTVRYVDEQNTPLLPEVERTTDSQTIYERYTAIPGYTLTSDPVQYLALTSDQTQNIVTFTYKSNATKYTIHYVLQDPSGNEADRITEVVETDGSGNPLMAGALVTIVAPADKFANGELAPGNVLTKNINGSGTTEFTVIYKQHALTVKVALTDGVMAGKIVAPSPNTTVEGHSAYQEVVLSGKTVSLSTAPILPGYHFVKWTLDYGALTDPNAAATSFVMPFANAVVVAHYEMDDPIPLTITANSFSHDYDGAAHTASGYTAEGLLDGHALSGVSAGRTETVAGNYENVIVGTPVVTRTSDGLDVTYMYGIQTVIGWLNIGRIPLTITPENRVVTYDGTKYFIETFTASGLVSGHTLDTTGLRSEEGLIDAGSISVGIGLADQDKIKVYSGTGESRVDVTANYYIATGKGTLTVKPRELELTAASGAAGYDGNIHHIKDDLTSLCYTVKDGCLVNGDQVDASSVSITGSGINAGSYDTDLVPAAGGSIKVMNGQKDVTGNYTLKLVPGTLRIGQARLTVIPDSAEKVYNGQTQTITTYTVAGLIGGDEVAEGTVTVYGGGTIVGGYAVTVTSSKDALKIVKSDGTTIDPDNYDISFGSGQLTILPRPLVIQAGVESYVFNGEAQSVQGYTVETGGNSGLVDGHSLVPESVTQNLSGSQRDVGSKVTSITTTNGIRINDAGGNNVTGNYAITTTGGMITVTARPLYLDAGSPVYTYNGSEQKIEDYDYTARPYDAAGKTGLVPGHVIDGDTMTLTGKRTEVGDTETSITNTDAIVILNGLVNEAGNYDIRTEKGLLTITKKKLILYAGNETYDFDGATHTVKTFTVDTQFGLENGDVLDEDSVKAKLSGAIRDAGSATTYITSTDGIKIMNGTKDVTQNYDIVLETGTLTVNKLKITVYAGTESHVYDGEEHTVTEYDVVGAFAGTDHVAGETVKMTGSRTDVGFVTTKIKDDAVIRVEDANGVDEARNYEITKATGRLTITKRPLVIQAGVEEYVFNGAEQTVQGYTPLTGVNSGLVDGHSVVDGTVTPLLSGGRRDVGTTTATITSTSGITVKDGASNTVTGNYDITVTPGSITIRPRPVTVIAGTEVHTYTGLPHTVTTFDVSAPGVDTGLVTGHKVENVKLEGTQIDKGYVVTKIVNTKEKDDRIEIWNGTTEETDNYLISTETGTLTVGQAIVTLKVVSGSLEYNGAEQTLTQVVASGLAAGHTFVDGTVSTAGSRKNVGFVTGNITIPSTAGVKVKDSAGNEVQDNYTFVTEAGTLTITAKDLIITAESGSVEYDGYNHSITDLESPAFTWSGNVAGDELQLSSVTVDGTGRNAKTYTTSILNKNAIVVMRGTENVTINYNIILRTGELEITKKKLGLIADNLGVTYDAQTHTVTTYTVDSLNGLGYGDTLDASTITVLGSGMNVGSHTVSFVNPVGIAVKTGSEDATGNYDIVTVPGSIEIAKRDLLITAGTEQHQFDGYDHTVETYLIDGLQGSDKEVKSSIPLVGTRREIGNVETSVSTKDGIIIKANGGTGTDVTGNYNISLGTGTLSIRAEGITLTADSLAKVFTGETFVVNTYTVVGLRSDYKLENVKVYTTLRDVDKVEVTFIEPEKIVIRDENGEDVTKNYAIDLKSGWLEVTPATVTLRVVDGSLEYNGQHQTLTAVVASGLAAGDALVDGSVTTTGSRRDVGFVTGNITIPSVTGAKVKDGAGKEVQSNYTFVTQAGTLTISARDLTIQADNTEFTYNGQYQSQATYTVVQGGVVGGDVLGGVEITGSIRDVGATVANVVGGAITVTNGTDDRTGNYNIVLQNGTLKVNPKGITITAQSAGTDFNGEIQNIVDVATGNGLDTFIVAGLEAGDLIDASTVTVTGEGRVKGNYDTAIANVDQIRIYRNTENVTGNYTITTVPGTLAIGTQTLVIQGQTKTVVYDGTLRNITEVCAGLTPAEVPYVITSGALGAGDEILATSLSVTGSIQYVGSVATTVVPAGGGIRIVNNGNDVTDNYNIQVAPGTLTMGKANLALKADVESYAYTGKEQKAKEYVVVSGLGSGDAVTPTSVTLSGALTYVDTIDTSIVDNGKIQVMKGTKNVTDNYNIILEKGTLTITPVALVITADSAKKEFTGEIFDVKTFTAKTLLNGDAVKADTVTVSGERRNVGITPTVIKVEDVEKIKVLNGTKDVTDCYTITVEPGELEVTKKPITITAQSATTAFNGQTQNIMAVAVSQGKPTFLVSGLVDGDEVGASTVKVTGEGRDNGDYDTAIVDVDDIRIYMGSDDVTGNYSITTKPGTLTITGMALVIQAASATVEYNGNTRTIEEACGLASQPTYFVSVGQLAAGDAIDPTSFSVTGSIKYVGNMDTTIKAATGGIKIMNGAQDVTKNYAITTEKGTLTMTPRDLYIQAGVESYTYNGKEQKVQGYTPRAGDLVNGDTVQPASVTLSGSGTDVGTSDTEVLNKDGIRVLNGTTKVTDNYNIILAKGTLTITPAKVILQAGTGSAVYNGQTQLFKDVAADQSLALYKVVTAPLNGDQVLAGTVTVDGERLNVGEAGTVIEAVNIPSIRIFAKDNVTERTDNYEIEVLPGKLTITPRVVTITPENKSKTYGDIDPALTFTVDGLIFPDDVDVQLIRELGDSAGRYTISVTSATLQPGVSTAPGFGEAGCNYTLKLNTSTLAIGGKELIIQAGSDTQVFSGQTYTVGNAFTPTGLEPGDQVVASTVTVNGTRRNVGTTTTSIASTTAIRVMNSSGQNVTGNYIIKSATGTLTVTPKPITIYAGTQSFTYNGAIQKVTKVTVPAGALADGDAVDMSTVTLSGSRKDVGTETTEILTPGADIKIKTGTKDASANYTIGTDTGVLTITQKKLVITASKETHEYDATEHIADGFTTSGLVGGDTVDAGTVQVTGSRRNVGSTPVLIVNGGGIAVKNGQTTVTGNYEITTADGALTISPRQVTIGGDWFTKYNGDFDPTLTATVVGLVNGDKVTYKLTRDPGEENAVYQVRISNVKFTMADPSDVSDPSSPDFNYSLVEYQGKLTILGRVTYNANGGRGAVPTDNSGYARGDGISVKFSPTPSKNGMKFIGWSTSANASIPTYYEGGTTRMYMGTQNIDLYAVYSNADTSRGTVEYYFDGELNRRLTYTMHNLVVGSKVTSYPGVRMPGYREVDVENLPMVVDADESLNVIRVYYEKIESGVMIVDADIPLGAGTASLNVGECIE